MDLFLMTSSVSSPSGPGSDSESIALTFGGHNTYLTDSSQFGFEPVLIGGIPRAYCYLASMRGEDPDKRHLNQFYHCEYEAQGNFVEAQKLRRDM
jgi:asparaginyl-tRNA synthetase